MTTTANASGKGAAEAAKARRNKQLLWGGVGALILLGLFWAFSPRAIDVDLVEVTRAQMAVSVSEEGEIRVKDVHVVAAPVSGELERVTVEAGDPVTAGQTLLAAIRPGVSPVLDQRSETQLRAAAEAARAGVKAAEADIERARSARDLAHAEVTRLRPIVESGAIAPSTLDQAESSLRSAVATLRTAISVRSARQFELAAAEAALSPSAPADDDCSCYHIMAQHDGLVLRVLRESEGPVAMGAPIVEVGDTQALELFVDVLSRDAVAVKPGDHVRIKDWGGPVLDGVVRTVEPFAFTYISALGIEEQRVNIVIDITDHEAAAGRLGHGYRAFVDIVVWRSDDAVTAPLTALFREGGDWAAFVVRNNRAELTLLEIGHMNNDVAEVLSGLAPGDQIIAYPADAVADGTRVKGRKTG